MLIPVLILKLRRNDILSCSTHFFGDHIFIDLLLIIITTSAGKIIWTFVFMRWAPLVANIHRQLLGHRRYKELNIYVRIDTGLVSPLYPLMNTHIAFYYDQI